MGAASRPRYRPSYPRAVGRPPKGRDRLSLSCVAPSGAAWVAESGVGNQRGESAGEVLPADGDGEGPTHTRARSVVATRARDWINYESRVKHGVTNMKPDLDELDDEIQGHMALSIKERVESGEDPEAARLAARKEFGNVLLTRDSIRRVWRHRLLDQAEALARDLRFALRSLLRAKGLTFTVVVTLALGIGANAAIFSVVRSVLLQPLVNRDPDRLLYIRQVAPGIGTDNMTFSVPEIRDLESGAK